MVMCNFEDMFMKILIYSLLISSYSLLISSCSLLRSNTENHILKCFDFCENSQSIHFSLGNKLQSELYCDCNNVADNLNSSMAITPKSL
jgi:hypothetical protein